MITTIRRYLRAFVLALKFTLRSEKPPLLRVSERYPRLAAWWRQTITLLDETEQQSDMNGLDEAARKTLTIRVDKREVSMATILATIRYHAEQEYPYLLVQNYQFNALTLQATNLNDIYLAQRLAESVPAAIQPVAAALTAHLQALPTESSEP